MSQEDNNNATQYLNEMISNNPHRQTIHQTLQTSQQNLTNNIQSGSLHLNPNPQQIYLHNPSPSPKKPSSISFIHRDFDISSSKYQEQKRVRQQFSHSKTVAVVKQVQTQVKQWKEKHHQVHQRYLEDIRKQQEGYDQRKEKSAKERVEEFEREKIERYQRIQEGIKRIEDRKMERVTSMSQSRMRLSSLKPPLFVEKQRLKQEESRVRQEFNNAMLRTKRMSMNVNFHAIKAHQEQYLAKKQEHMTKKQKKSPKRERIPRAQSQFNLYINEDEQRRKLDLQKRERRKDFIKELKSRPKEELQASRTERKQEKGKEKEKGEGMSAQKKQKKKKSKKNSLHTNVDMYQMGNQYMKEMKEMFKDAPRKSTSTVILLPEPTQPRYRDYLAEIKARRPAPSKLDLDTDSKPRDDQISKIKHKYKDTQKAFKALNQRSASYEDLLKQRIKEMEKIDSYEDMVTKEKEVDELYHRAIQMKLACLDLAK